MEEFRFIVNNLPCAVNTLSDCEIVGEFVHCLRILGVGETTTTTTTTTMSNDDDHDVIKIINIAVDFLLDTEIKNGKRGEWVPRKRTTRAYDRYHAAYCGVVGLLDTVPPFPRVGVPVLMAKWYMNRKILKSGFGDGPKK